MEINLSDFIDIESIDIIIRGIPKVNLGPDFFDNIKNKHLILNNKKVNIHEYNLDISILGENTIKLSGNIYETDNIKIL